MNQQLLRTANEGHSHHRTSINETSRPRVLVIDDDIDATLPIQITLLELGFDVEMSADPRNAKKLLCSSSWDLIILDWLLDVNVTAPQILEESNKFIGKIEALHLDRIKRPSPIISFSVLPKSEVFVPKSDHFFHLTHWAKPVNYGAIRHRLLALLPYLRSINKGGV